MSADARPKPPGDEVCPRCGAAGGVPQLLTSMNRYFVCPACAERWQVTRNWERKARGISSIVLPLASAARRVSPIARPLRGGPHAFRRRLAVLAGTAVLGSIARRWLRSLRAVVTPAARNPEIGPGAALSSEQAARLEHSADALDLLRLEDDGGPGLDPGDSQVPAAQPS